MANGAESTYGGGIYVKGDATVDGSLIADNAAYATGSSYATTGVRGGGIMVAGALVITDSDVSANTAQTRDGVARGGGVYSGGDLTIEDRSIIGSNRASAGPSLVYGWVYGGGAFGFTNITIVSSTITSNVAQSECADCWLAGGGLFAHLGAIGVRDGSVVGNKVEVNSYSAAYGWGGGLATHSAGNAGKIDIQNSTVSGNSTTRGSNSQSFGSGGGIAMAGASSIVVNNSTIGTNQADDYAGGIYFRNGSTLDINSSIVSSNESAYSADLASSNSLTAVTISGTHNIIGIWSDEITFPDEQPATEDPALFALANNGGTGIPTHALGACSPAIDAGSNDLALTTDQRGDPFVRSFGAAPDIGAHENQPFTDRLLLGDFERVPCLPN